MQFGETLVGNAQLDAGDRALDRVDVFPVDIALRNLAPDAAGERSPRALDPEPAEQAGGADVDGDEVEGSFDLVEAQVVDADHLAAVDVDDLAIHQVLLEADLVGPLLELGDVDRGRAERCAAGVQ
jgi:hypothetical protein